MGDWEDTFGAGVDAVNVIEGYPTERKVDESVPAPFVFPSGMPLIERDLFVKLSEYTREMEPHYGLRHGELLSDWTLLRIVSDLPETEAELIALAGTRFDSLHDFIEAIHEARHKKYAFYKQQRQRILKNYENLTLNDSDD